MAVTASRKLHTTFLAAAGWIAFAGCPIHAVSSHGWGLALAQLPPMPGGPAAEAAASAAPLPVPTFDVISVKPDKTGSGMMRMQFTQDGLRADNLPVHMLLIEGYGLNEDQLLSEPGWTKTDRFDVEAKVAGPDVAAFTKLPFDQRRAMFKQILTERFKLAAHNEKRDLPVYVLTVGKGGPKFKESKPLDPASADDKPGNARFGGPGGQGGPDGPSAKFGTQGGPGGPADKSGGPGGPGPRRGPGIMMGRGKIQAQSISITMFATVLSRQLGRTVIDKTGLTGNYDITLEFTPEGGGGPMPGGPPGGGEGGSTGAPPPPDSTGPSVFTAIQEQLGLKLDATKGPADVLVIDHIEKPTEN